MDTDVISGMEAGLRTVLVLSGVTQAAEIERFPYRPSLVRGSVAELSTWSERAPTTSAGLRPAQRSPSVDG